MYIYVYTYIYTYSYMHTLARPHKYTHAHRHTERGEGWSEAEIYTYICTDIHTHIERWQRFKGGGRESG